MLPLFKVHKPDSYEFINEVLNSEKLSFGRFSILFESRLEELFGVPKVFLTNSYSNSWITFLDSLNLNHNDEIIASPIACLASTQPLIRYGAKLKWCDVNPKNGLLDPNDLLSIINFRTKAVIINHFCGYVPQLREIYQIAKEYGATVIHDIIEGHGNLLNNEYTVSQYCDAAIISFEPIRMINSLQAGGIIVNNLNLIPNLELSRDFGINRDNFRLPDGEINPNCDIIIRGLGSRSNELSAAYGLENLKSFNEILNQHKLNGEFLNEFLNCLPFNIETVEINENTIPNYWVYGILCEQKDELMAWFRENKIQSSAVHIRNDIYSIFSDSRRNLKGVDEFSRKFLAIPSGWWVNKNHYNNLL